MEDEGNNAHEMYLTPPLDTHGKQKEPPDYQP
jgi:hypothetical protein